MFKLLLAEGKITEEVVQNIRSWSHSGFSVDQSVRAEAEDSEGLQRLIEYFLFWCQRPWTAMVASAVKKQIPVSNCPSYPGRVTGRGIGHFAAIRQKFA